ncbi:efflux RND transporter periplasmic adaptor subunit [Hugenholtzia roseola]|uniref:efflux RND transporter periplasmic adaptor subunit n=1 Tax=Hugenholtzia roseola TaxID=1002 RepID=UPI0012B61417|nr:HlyD family efflux transporter periplasmic adaptor subunit [Hugenholtzia roseola]
MKNLWQKGKWWLLALPLLATALFFYFRQKKSQLPLYQVERKTLVESVYASATLLPQTEYKVFANADGTLLQKRASEGAPVRADEVLFLIDKTDPSLRLNTARQAYLLAKENYGKESPLLAEMRLALANAKIQLENDSINWLRFQNLWAQKATSQVEYDRSRTLYQNSQNNYALQKSRLAKLENDLKFNLENSQNQMQLSQKQLEDYAVRSFIEGVVLETYKEEGESVRRGEVLALLADPKRVYLRLEVDELDIERVKIGQPILVKLDVYKDTLFKAKVSKIYYRLNKQNQSFRVDAEFEGEVPNRFSGLTAEANILIQEKKDALVVPKTYLLGKDSLLVWDKESQSTQAKRIEKGIENFEWVEILSGIEEKQTLLKPQ